MALLTILPGDILQPIRGGAVRIVENMEASLQIPTATSVRTIPVRTLEENRRLLNKHREAAGQGKVSFTHLVAWAILRALDTFPRLNDAYAEVDGQPHRIQRDEVRLGIAVDVQKKDGSRTLLVPNIKGAQKLGFAEFLKAFDELVARSRKGAISPDDFMGTTVSLTNPGTVGTTSSAPRLMPGQGVIVATGALDYPAEYKSMAPRTLGHARHQQGDDGDVHLRPPHHPGRRVGPLPRAHRGAAQGRGRLLRARSSRTSACRTGRCAGRWTRTRRSSARPAGARRSRSRRRSCSSSTTTACAATWWPTSTRSTAHRAPHRDLDPATYGLTLWDLDREFLTGGLSGEDRATLREILDTLRETYCGTIGVEYMYIADPERKEWLQHRMESARNYPALDAASKSACSRR